MSNELSKYNWLSEISKDSHYPKLLVQIKKDFELSGLYIDISENTNPQELIENVSAELYQLIVYKFDIFMQLLYRIDVAEQLMKTNHVESAEVLTEKATYQILKREWQKIVWREQFK